MSAIAKSYWRIIQRVPQTRAFDSLPESVKDDVRDLARSDVEAQKITPERYEELIGEAYEA